jgi:hypothetical protein
MFDVGPWAPYDCGNLKQVNQPWKARYWPGGAAGTILTMRLISEGLPFLTDVLWGELSSPWLADTIQFRNEYAATFPEIALLLAPSQRRGGGRAQLCRLLIMTREEVLKVSKLRKDELISVGGIRQEWNL